jgi:hypothetical protein
MTVMDMGRETIKTKGSKFLLDESQFDGISRCKRIPNNRNVFMA